MLPETVCLQPSGVCRIRLSGIFGTVLSGFQESLQNARTHRGT